MSVAAPTIEASLDGRFVSGLKDERVKAAKFYEKFGVKGPSEMVGLLRICICILPKTDRWALSQTMLHASCLATDRFRHLQALKVMHLPVDLEATKDAFWLFLSCFSTARQQLRMRIWLCATLILTCPVLHSLKRCPGFCRAMSRSQSCPQQCARLCMPARSARTLRA